MADAQAITGVLANTVLLFGAIGAGIKFRLFNVLGHRWQSDLDCAHYEMPDGTIVFTADYTVTNRGQRPLSLRAVSMRLVAARREGNLLVPDETHVFAERMHRISESGLKGNSLLEPTERSIYTLRAVLGELPDVVFVICAIDAFSKRHSTQYRGFYSRWPAVNRTHREPVASPPPT